MKVEADADVYVITTAKKRDSLDWEGTFVRFGVGVRVDGTTGGVLTVDSWNNIGRYRNVRNAFFVFDEQRIVGSGEWTKVFLQIARHNRWILLSATPGDTWLDYVPVFLANGFYKNRTEFKREHVVYSSWSKFPKVERYVSVSKLVRLQSSILVEMPYQPHTVRHLKRISVDHDRKLMERVEKDRWHVYENRPLRDASELFSVMRRVANSDSSRVTALRSLMRKHSKLIVFYNFNYELDLLRKALSSTASTDHSSGTTRGTITPPAPTAPSVPPSSTSEGLRTVELHQPAETRSSEPLLNDSRTDVPPAELPGAESASRKSDTSGDSHAVDAVITMAEWNGHRHEPIPETERWVYLVQYTAGAEGWECTATDAMVFYSQTYSYKIFVQAQGRIDRLNTPFRDLYYYTLVSDSFIDKIVARALSVKKSFNEAAFINKLTRKEQ